MRFILRLARIVLVIVATVVVVVGTVVGGFVWLTLPGGDMTVAIPGLSAPVAIDIDSDGIPRIRAANDLDGAAALGFLHARERLFQMELMRRAVSGEIAEIAGPGALPLDRLMRTLGVRRRAEADLAALPADTRAMLAAYARGVNAWIDRRGRFASEEFAILGRPRPWTEVDSVLWGKTMGLYLSGNWRVELARRALAGRLKPDVIDALWPTAAGGAGHPEARAVPNPAAPNPAAPNPAAPNPAAPNPAAADAAARLAEALPTFPDPFTHPNEASNEWAVDGAHSATGAPLLAGDPHLEFSLPGIWYLARIETPHGVLVGATAPGVPFLVIGHNAHIAWTFTTTGSDTQDLFIETPVGANRYATPDGPEPFVVREEVIHVRGAPDEVWTVRETRHGPVISDLTAPGGPPLALSIASLMPGDVAAAGLYALNAATDVLAAGRAAAGITAPNQNLLVADHDRIALFVTGRVPIRRAGDGSVPEPGADGAHDWVGWAEGDALPHIVAPASGRLVNANERIAPPDFPVFIARDWFGDERARRIRELLAAHPKASVADFVRMQLDATSVVARDLLPRLRQITPADPRDKAALALLDGWDGTMAIDRPQPLIFNAWMRDFDTALLRTDAGLGRGGRGAAAPWPVLIPATLAAGIASPLCAGGDCDDLLAEALHEAVTRLSARFGPDAASWRWGDAHRAIFAHPLLRAAPALGALLTTSIAQPGDDTTIDRGGLRAGDFASIHGAAYRGVYDLADLDASRFVVAPGQSGHFLSRLARNFVQRWRDGDTITIGPQAAHVDVAIRLEPAGMGD